MLDEYHNVRSVCVTHSSVVLFLYRFPCCCSLAGHSALLTLIGSRCGVLWNTHTQQSQECVSMCVYSPFSCSTLRRHCTAQAVKIGKIYRQSIFMPYIMSPNNSENIALYFCFPSTYDISVFNRVVPERSCASQPIDPKPPTA